MLYAEVLHMLTHLHNLLCGDTGELARFVSRFVCGYVRHVDSFMGMKITEKRCEWKIYISEVP